MSGFQKESSTDPVLKVFSRDHSYQKMDAPVSSQDRASSRYFIGLVVVLAHAGLIAAILLSRPQFSREPKERSYTLSLLRLPNDSTTPGSAKIHSRLDAAALHLNIARDLSPPIPNNNNVITLEAPEEQKQLIDLDRESALAVQSSIARAATDESYRNLSGLTPEQRDWIKKHHMEPVPGFQWDRSSRGQMLRHGIIKLNAYCVLVVLIPFCQFGGKIQYNGDLFKDMHDPKLPDQ